MRTSKVTTLVLMTLVWWVFSPDTTIHPELTADSALSQPNTDNLAISTLP